MSPIRDQDLFKNIIPVSYQTNATDVYDLIRVKTRSTDSSEWMLIVDDVDNSYSVILVDIFLSWYDRDHYGKYRSNEIMGDVLRVVPSIRIAAIELDEIMGIDHARDILRRIGTRMLVILHHRTPVGLVLEKDRSFDEGSIYNQPTLFDEYFSDAEAPPIAHPADVEMEAPLTAHPRDVETETSSEYAMPEREEISKTAPRYANVWLVRQDKKLSILPKTNTLVIGGWYDLRLNIGKLSKDSVVENAKEQPFPSDLLLERKDGHWLQAVAVSETFYIPRQRFDFFLPNEGESWVCKCPPGGEHKKNCSQNLYVQIPLRAPAKPGEADIRLGIYYQNNLVQSQLFTALVAKREEQTERGYSSQIDYSLVTRLDDMGFLQPRSLNILTNKNQNGTHRFMINGLEDEVLTFSFSESAMQAAIDEARQGLRNLYSLGMGSKAKRSTIMGEVKERKSFLERLKQIWDQGLLGGGSTDNHPSSDMKPKETFIADLKRLATLGCYLYTHLLVQNSSIMNERLRQHLRSPGVIQVARIRNSQFVFPWGLVYDIPLETSHPEKFNLCRLIDQFDILQDVILNRQTQDCPFETEHTSNTLCPYGFWGFRHIIEQPPSARPPSDVCSKNDRIYTSISCKRPFEAVMAVSTQLDPGISKAHLENLREAMQGFDLQPVETTTDLVNRLCTQDIEVLYFYCHGKDRAITEGSVSTKPYLEIGKDDKIETADILVWLSEMKNHWDLVHPLVFINGCHTAELSPEALVSFVDMFALVNAAGVIGTEITMDQITASEAAEQFLKYFVRQISVGQAIQKMRTHFLAKGNLLGLAYTSYCSADLILSGLPS